MAVMRYTDKGALLSSPYEQFRYRLWRRWDDTCPVLAWVMLNPSTADGAEDDATIRKCVGFADRWGYGGIEVVNLFAWRAREPVDLKAAGYPMGEFNHDHIRVVLRGSHDVMCAWGANANCPAGRTAAGVLANLAAELDYHNDFYALKISKTGTPWHPLYVPYATERIPFKLYSLETR